MTKPKHTPQESLFDWRDRLIHEHKITICGYPTETGKCRQSPIDGKLCYWHEKVKEI